ncbi:LacI family DNA-binding transcriptional regulator [Wenxinia marina]|uniref:Transcriptional regulator n=1 Tax=Wenxinia marina DSM 24838 TaxID=1123501 RepID=A0A0D0QD72_9RHOB|nr:LacI family DNA-binding transcriptional regulator [Wenxinia marina]KIQ70257.1 Transcriptional regulator [Wenxinia marina DSM 24838]GGL49985.1 LacI family transcriptional regulator [Wenxinia marina]
MRVTAHDVALAAGVSRSAVSRAFSPEASIESRKRAHILAVAESLGYRPNLIARGLTGRGSGLIAVVVGNVSSPYEAWFLDVLAEAIRAEGLLPLLLPVSPGQELEPALDHALAYQVDGAVIAAGSVSRKLAERCSAMGAPVVVVGRVIEDGADSVCCDNRAGMALVVERLVAAGRRRVAWIGGYADTFSNIERLEGLTTGLSAAGLKLVDSRRGNYSVEGGLAQALTLLTGPEPVDAIVCGNDAMAIGALSAAQRLGRRVPGELSVTGFDDIPAASWEAYSLTTVRNPVETTVREALALLSARIAGEDGPPQVVRLAPELKLRRTL